LLGFVRKLVFCGKRGLGHNAPPGWRYLTTEDRQWFVIDSRMNNGSVLSRCCRRPPRRGGRREIDETSLMVFCGFYARGHLGGICPRSLAPGPRCGAFSTNGTATELWTRFFAVCGLCVWIVKISTKSCGVSTAPSYERPAVLGAAEKRGSQGASRPRIRPLARRFFHQNPFAGRWRRAPFTLPSDGRRGA
jgi:hypothetical protein